MNKLNEFKNIYKSNKPLFNTVILFVMAFLIVWQTIFTLIIPSRINIIILLALISGLIVFYFKNTTGY